MTASVGPTNGERRRAGQAAATSAIVSGPTMNASKRWRPFPQGAVGHERDYAPVAKRPIGARESGAVDARPAAEHDGHQGNEVGGQRKPEESFHPSLSVASRRPDGNDK